MYIYIFNNSTVYPKNIFKATLNGIFQHGSIYSSLISRKLNMESHFGYNLIKLKDWS